MKNLALALSLAFTMVFAASCDKQGGGESNGSDTTKTVDTLATTPMDTMSMTKDTLVVDTMTVKKEEIKVEKKK